MIVVDTSVLVDVLRGEAAAVHALDAALADGPVAASVLTRVELLAGMRSDERRSVRRLIEVLPWLEVDEAISQRAGELARAHRRSHPGVDVVDYVIAATAEHHAAELWTRNLKHFPMFEGLEAPYG